MTHVEYDTRLNKMCRLRQRCRDIEEMVDALIMDVTPEQVDQLEKANELIQWVKADIGEGNLKGEGNAGQ